MLHYSVVSEVSYLDDKLRPFLFSTYEMQDKEKYTKYILVSS